LQDYQTTLKFLYDLQLFGIKAGLRNIECLVRFLGHPERHFPCIHIAGTNGKGSTAAMIASMLTASDYRTGLYTSPHLIDFTERIRIDGKKIGFDDVVRYTISLRPMIEKLKATFFEATTAIAFQYFADQKVDIAIVETGLGGRLDATNVVTPLLSVITNIGLDHTEHLGATQAKIAYEKGGIIKPSVPCLAGTTDPIPLRVLRRISQLNRTNLLQVERISSVTITSNSLQGLAVNLTTTYHTYNNLFVSLAGEHQARNLQLAVLAVERLKNCFGFSKISKPMLVEGLQRIQHYSKLRGRLDVFRRSPLIIADVAHNPDGTKALAAALRKIIIGRVVLVFGAMKDKNYSEMLEVISPITRLTIAVRPNILRALETKWIVEKLNNGKKRSINAGNVHLGIKIAQQEIGTIEPILITGSHYVVGEAMKFFKISV
jgi:dihydrofolate synthase / folylpolyglutamate synthase